LSDYIEKMAAQPAKFNAEEAQNLEDVGTMRHQLCDNANISVD
jgi:small-conductance mechanosensitive channel